ncbi:MAG: aminotransferase class V-fold PLP-dependent enzyme [Actinomycetota bacterium]
MTSVDRALVEREFAAARQRVWLNAAHQGPLPQSARDVAEEALDEKASPWSLEDSEFWDMPATLRAALSPVIGAPPVEVILGNSTSYGLNLLAHGLPLKEGDEVLVVDGDFPATVVTWFPLRERGINVRLLKPSGAVVTAEDVAGAITPATRVFASSWVFSFTGHAIDVEAIGNVCRDNDVLFVLNGSQAVGTRVLDISSAPVDALVGCGFKWLCGPYATGYAWIRSSVVETLGNRPAYWLSQIGESDLGSGADYGLRDDLGASAFDVFCTANFVNFGAWAQSLRLLMEMGIDRIESHNAALIDRIVAGLDNTPFTLLSPAEGPSRSTLLFISHEDPSKNDAAHEALIEKGVHIAKRAGSLRVAPHVYNDENDVDRLLDGLREVT